AMLPRPSRAALFPYTTLFRSHACVLAPELQRDLAQAGRHLCRDLTAHAGASGEGDGLHAGMVHQRRAGSRTAPVHDVEDALGERSEEHTSEPSHVKISYAVFC